MLYLSQPGPLVSKPGVLIIPAPPILLDSDILTRIWRMAAGTHKMNRIESDKTSEGPAMKLGGRRRADFRQNHGYFVSGSL